MELQAHAAGGQLVPEELLAKADKILFITHLAIGDFTYMQNYFKAFSQKYPHIKIDLWVDETRRTRLFWLWKSMQNYVLIDWLKACPFFSKIYFGSYSWGRFNQLKKEALAQNYPIIVSLATLRSNQYLGYAREMGPKSFVAGVVHEMYADRREVKLVDACYVVRVKAYKDAHITDIYAGWFEALLGIHLTPQEKRPFVAIPKEWRSYGKLKFVQWGLPVLKEGRQSKVVFVNIFAKDMKRCWPLDRLVQLLMSLRMDSAYEDVTFLVNTEPESYDGVKTFLSNFCLQRVILFTARENFFQLPSIIALCDLVISVETSVIHLAAALDVPVIALMRTKNPEWIPYATAEQKIIAAQKRKDWVEDIQLDHVMREIKGFKAFGGS